MTPVKSYHPNGLLEVEGFLADNLQVGSWTYYHDNGVLFTKGQFNSEGIPFGVWTEYYPNGQVKYEAISEQGNSFSLDSDYLQILNYWTEDGKYLIQNGNGKLTIYFDNGNAEHTSIWTNNLKNGLLQEFYPSGQLNIERIYKNGVKDGESKIFHENANTYISCFYQNGKPVASYKEWYKNGQICEEGFYTNEQYFIDNFWDETGTQRLYKGNGYVIRKEGAGEIDIYKQDFINYVMTNEKRL
ncbi:MAG: hypothetical protein ABIS01_06830 [Ferruginibacter sp.]